MASGILGTIIALQDREQAKKERDRRFKLDKKKFKLEKKAESRLRSQGERSLGLAERAEDRLTTTSNRSLDLEERRLTQASSQFSEQLGFGREQLEESRRASKAGEALETRKQNFLETTQAPYNEALTKVNNALADLRAAELQEFISEDMKKARQRLVNSRAGMSETEYRLGDLKLKEIESRLNDPDPETRRVFGDMYAGMKQGMEWEQQAKMYELQLNSLSTMIQAMGHELSVSKFQNDVSMQNLNTLGGAMNMIKETFGEAAFTDLFAQSFAQRLGMDVESKEGHGTIEGWWSDKPPTGTYRLKEKSKPSGTGTVAPSESLSSLLNSITNWEQDSLGVERKPLGYGLE